MEIDLPLDTIICGDCLEVMKGWPDSSVDLVVTDPPYGHNNNNNDMIARWEAIFQGRQYDPKVDVRPIANDGIEANQLYQDFLKVGHKYKRGN